MPTVSNCSIHDGNEAGLLVYEKGQGTIEGCDIYSNGRSGVDVKKGGDPTIRDCKIHNRNAFGVIVRQGGRGTMEGCDIFANRYAAVYLTGGADPLVGRQV